WPLPMGRGRSSQAWDCISSETKRERSTLRMAFKTDELVMPLPSICSCIIFSFWSFIIVYLDLGIALNLKLRKKHVIPLFYEIMVPRNKGVNSQQSLLTIILIVSASLT